MDGGEREKALWGAAVKPRSRSLLVLTIGTLISIAAGLAGPLALAATSATSASPPASDDELSLGTPDGLYQPRTLDGVTIEAVETYLNPKDSELTLGMSWYPFNPYYNGLGIGAGYMLHFSRTFAWEILNANYVYTFDKGLTTELASKFNFEPRQIEKLQFAFGTNVYLTHTNGKLVFMKDFVRYFKSSIVLGAAVMDTSQRFQPAGTIGVRFEVFTSETFSWKLDLRDSIAVPSFDHFVTFTLGTGFSF
jgi:outer membrane beta-barrel protein